MHLRIVPEDIMARYRKSRALVERLVNMIRGHWLDMIKNGERAEDETNWAHVYGSGNDLLLIADTLMKYDIDAANSMIIDLEIILSSFIYAARPLDNEKLDSEISAYQAAKARAARKNKPKELALMDAIREVLVARPDEDLNKRGLPGRILPTVNRALTRAGHDEVNADVVRRRLKELRS
jgi:hypothetical protein